LRRICSSKDFRTTETLVNQSVRIESTNGSGHVNGGFRRPVDGYQAAMRIAVIAHRGKNLGGGLAELRRLLADEGYDAPPWYEVPKSRKAPKKARKARDGGADLVLGWGGDGMVQRCVDALAGSD